MNRGDTSIGGVNQGFPKTTWSDILGAADPADPRCHERLDRLLRTYWRPVYAYVRAAWRKGVEDSKDLTQAFFAHMLDKGYLTRVRPERGSFRSYLKMALKHFLIDAARAEKSRRPKNPLLSLEADPAEFERLGPAAPDDTPESAYDRAWIHGLLDTALGELKERLVQENKATYFDVFHSYCIDPHVAPESGSRSGLLEEVQPGHVTYKDIAAKLGLNDCDVRNYLSYCRDLFADILRVRIRDYVVTNQDVDLELSNLIDYIR